MPYEDSSFDVAAIGWVLAYSNDNPKMIDEVCRVVRPGGYVAIGCQYPPLSAAEYSEKYGMTVEERPTFAEPDDVLKLFGDRIGEVAFQTGPLASDRATTGDVVRLG